ncbi:MAG: hypothetical protein HYZ57_06050 [Acidobacteria bacterium]|nr:hypothetical protein [Acidobacteriota bacterium]MBI3279389.1 hypothetical protein [Acidobacteriota bacterium]
MRAALAVPLVTLLVCAGCGYHVSGHADLLPRTIGTISVPAFDNLTTRYKLSDRLPAAITREFISRTRYRIVADDTAADAVLRGAVVNYLAYPTIFDQVTGRAAGVQLSIFLQLSLTETGSGKVLFSRPNMEVRQRYEISTDQLAYFEESDLALERLSRDVARTVVSAILEAF